MGNPNHDSKTGEFSSGAGSSESSDAGSHAQRLFGGSNAHKAMSTGGTSKK